MKRFDLPVANSQPNFIGSWILEPVSLCDELVDYFETHQAKQKKGKIEFGIDLDVKDAVDISILPNEVNLPGNEIFGDYFQALFDCHKDYLSQWEYLATIAENLEIGSFNLQRYFSGQHFKKIHAERTSLNTLHRVLAWMTYLNDVEDGGTTYFSHYDLEVQPQKGLTLIWPAEWTHAHRGDVVNEGSKYIITGWMNFSG